jgi:hypothetical protein
MGAEKTEQKSLIATFLLLSCTISITNTGYSWYYQPPHTVVRSLVEVIRLRASRCGDGVKGK